ncbi:hypothetical protein P4O66_003165 [Electrophorus voltai]|uniref:Uncharacterized protein n=1 Tax=Electrophorus voltai TaxID=2609070 RepID=A0AAD9DN49_9TELE|nr:hypothetical protein P4O66_003165 [Electrophorus voltai]
MKIAIISYGYPNIVATYGRGYTGFAPSYSYQFPEALARASEPVQPGSRRLGPESRSCESPTPVSRGDCVHKRGGDGSDSDSRIVPSVDVRSVKIQSF